MRMIRNISIVLIIFGILSWGCSGGMSPVVPQTNEFKSESAGYSHQAWGVFTFICDPANEMVNVIPLREAAMHLNVLPFLEPPPFVYLTIESLEFSGSLVEADIGLTHPFLALTEFTGFDVCGTLFTHGSVMGFDDPDLVMAGEGDTRLLNPDGYSRWWNPSEFPHGSTIFNYVEGLLGTSSGSADYNTTLNGYKYFADGLGKDEPLGELDLSKRGMFGAGQKHVRHYTIDLSGGLIFNYAVDACWQFPQGDSPWQAPDDFAPEANRSEAWMISVAELNNTLYYDDSTGEAGGDLQLLIDVYDWFDADLNEVSIESLSGLPYTSSANPVDGGEGYSTYQVDLTGDDLTENGDIELLVTVECEESGYDGLLPGKPVCAYFKHVANVSSQGQSHSGWARTWNSTGSDTCWGVAVDSSNYIYVTGHFNGTVDFDPGPAIDERTGGKADAYLSKFNSDGDYQWALNWGAENFWPEASGYDVAVDAYDNVYVTGFFENTADLDPGDGVDNHTSNGGVDVFLSKFNSDGDFQWARSWGGSVYDFGVGVTADDFGKVYVTGRFSSTVDFDPGPGTDNHTAPDTSGDVYLSQFDSSGDFQWARTWGGPCFDIGQGVAVDSLGNPYIAGYFDDTVDFDPGTGTDSHTAGGYGDAFISKFNSTGDFQWAQTWGGTSGVTDTCNDVALDSSNNVYVTGRHSYDGYLRKFDSNGNFQWNRAWGGYHLYPGDFGYGVVVDDSGSVYVAGLFKNTVDFDPGMGVDSHTSNGQLEAYLSKFNLDGDFQWARTLGGIHTDIAKDVDVDEYGNIYMSGEFSSTVDFDPGPDIDDHTANSGGDVYLIKFLPDGYW